MNKDFSSTRREAAKDRDGSDETSGKVQREKKPVVSLDFEQAQLHDDCPINVTSKTLVIVRSMRKPKPNQTKRSR